MLGVHFRFRKSERNSRLGNFRLSRYERGLGVVAGKAQKVNLSP